jgi:hypothetical protein
MSVTILTFSVTGNTRLAAKRVAAKLTQSGKHRVKHASLVKLSREVDPLGLEEPLLMSAREFVEPQKLLLSVALPIFSILQIESTHYSPNLCCPTDCSQT